VDDEPGGALVLSALRDARKKAHPGRLGTGAERVKRAVGTGSVHHFIDPSEMNRMKVTEETRSSRNGRRRARFSSERGGAPR
jgi:hypothetical protein